MRNDIVSITLRIAAISLFIATLLFFISTVVGTIVMQHDQDNRLDRAEITAASICGDSGRVETYDVQDQPKMVFACRNENGKPGQLRVINYGRSHFLWW